MRLPLGLKKRPLFDRLSEVVLVFTVAGLLAWHTQGLSWPTTTVGLLTIFGVAIAFQRIRNGVFAGCCAFLTMAIVGHEHVCGTVARLTVAAWSNGDFLPLLQLSSFLITATSVYLVGSCCARQRTALIVTTLGWSVLIAYWTFLLIQTMHANVFILSSIPFLSFCALDAGFRILDFRFAAVGLGTPGNGGRTAHRPWASRLGSDRR